MAVDDILKKIRADAEEAARQIVAEGRAAADAVLSDAAANLESRKAELTAREAEVINLYFGLNSEKALTLEEIGARFNLTRERVRQIKEKAIRRLRHASRSRSLRAYLS